MVANLVHLGSGGPIGRSVLAVAIVYSVLFAVAAFMVAFAVWRANGSGTPTQGPELPYVVDRVEMTVGRSVLPAVPLEEQHARAVGNGRLQLRPEVA